MKKNDPCPFCEKHWKRQTPVFSHVNEELGHHFTCMLCFRSYDQDGNLVFTNKSDTLTDSSECPECGFHSGLILTSRKFGKLRIYTCHQCHGLFKENKKKLTDEEWAHVWMHVKD